MKELYIPRDWPQNKEQVKEFAEANSIHNFSDLAEYKKAALEEIAKHDGDLRDILVKKYCERLKDIKELELANQIYELLKQEKPTAKEASSILELTQSMVTSRAMEKII